MKITNFPDGTEKKKSVLETIEIIQYFFFYFFHFKKSQDINCF